jgi:hypothetical protein
MATIEVSRPVILLSLCHKTINVKIIQSLQGRLRYGRGADGVLAYTG